MSQHLPDSIKLFGTDEPVPPVRRLVAGPLSCEFDQGALRYIRVAGNEAIRNIAFVVRDQNWGTYKPSLSDIHIVQHEHSFVVSYHAECGDEEQKSQYTASIIGDSDGSLSYTATYTAKTDFLANRVGFVVLHPIAGVSGKPVEIEHVNGELEHSVFPDHVDPMQPFKNIRALTYAVAPGVSIVCHMSGDIFEMEDHRQWNDASYKTYVRPLAKPWPFIIAASDSLKQSVMISLSECPETSKSEDPMLPMHGHHNQETEQVCVVTISESKCSKPMPKVGIGLEPQHCASAQACLKLLNRLAPQQLVVWHDLALHTTKHLEAALVLAKALDTEIELQAVIPDLDYKAEVCSLKAQCLEAGVDLYAIHVSPAAYLKSIMPGPAWPDVTDLGALYKEVRKHFPGVLIGGGMLSFFPELNRHRPPIDDIDYISHSSNTITHASDDTTVMENLEAIPHIVKTCRTFAGNKAYHVGPSSIGLRFNPYGSSTAENPRNGRIAMARMDPRQRGLFNAAWTIGYAAHMVRGGIDCINLHAPTGEFGILNQSENWSCPGYDGTDRLVYPVFHALAGCIKGAGKTRLLVYSSKGCDIQAFGYKESDKRILWIANLTAKSILVKLDGFDETCGIVSTLSLDTFDQCTNDMDGFDLTATEGCISPLRIGPYGVVRIIG